MPGPFSERAAWVPVPLPMLPEMFSVVPAAGTIDRASATDSGAAMPWEPLVTEITAVLPRLSMVSVPPAPGSN